MKGESKIVYNVNVIKHDLICSKLACSNFGHHTRFNISNNYNTGILFTTHTYTLHTIHTVQDNRKSYTHSHLLSECMQGLLCDN